MPLLGCTVALCACYAASWYRCSPVCLSVGHNREPRKNGWTDWDAFWAVDSGGLKEPSIRWGPDPPRGRGNFGGCSAPVPAHPGSPGKGAIKRVCVYVCSAPLKMHCNSDSKENGCINYKIYIPTDSTWPETYTCIVCLHLHLRKKSSLKRRMHNSPHVNKQRWCNRARCVSGVNLTQFVRTAMWPFVKLLSPLVNKPNILTYTSVNKTVLPGQLFTPELLVMSQLQHNTHRPHRQTCRQTDTQTDRPHTSLLLTHATQLKDLRSEQWVSKVHEAIVR